MRRRVLVWFALAWFCLALGGPLCDLLLWAQEGALDQAEELTEQRQRATRGGRPSRDPFAVEEAAPEEPSHSWANMNWFALYLVLAGPTTYFVFRGAGR